MEYQILSANSPDILSSFVNRAIENGYRPLGGVSSVVATVDPNGNPDPAGALSVYFYQAVTKDL